MRPSSSSFRAARAGLCLALVACAALASCSDGGDADARPRPPTTAPATTTTDPADDLAPSEVVAALASDAHDLAPGEEQHVVAEGQPEAEQEPSTLGYCSAPLVNEDARIQRLHVALTDGDQVTATIDAALYEPGRAMAALRELGATELTCAPGPVPPLRGEGEREPSTWSSEHLAAAVTGGLTDDSWARTVTRTPAGRPPETTTVIAQRRGDALVVVTAPDQARALELAASAADRLAATNSHLIED